MTRLFKRLPAFENAAAALEWTAHQSAIAPPRLHSIGHAVVGSVEVQHDTELEGDRAMDVLVAWAEALEKKATDLERRAEELRR